MLQRVSRASVIDSVCIGVGIPLRCRQSRYFSVFRRRAPRLSVDLKAETHSESKSSKVILPGRAEDQTWIGQ